MRRRERAKVVITDQREEADSRLDSSSDLQGDEEEGKSQGGHGGYLLFLFICYYLYLYLSW